MKKQVGLKLKAKRFKTEIRFNFNFKKRDDFLSLSWVTRGFPAQRKEIKHGCRNMTVAWPGKEYAF